MKANTTRARGGRRQRHGSPSVRRVDHPIVAGFDHRSDPGGVGLQRRVNAA